MELPVAITRAGAVRSRRYAVTSNISSNGVLFTSDEAPAVGDPLEYTITLDSAQNRRVAVRCVGKVVRSEPVATPPGPPRYEVAATLERYEFDRSDQ